MCRSDVISVAIFCALLLPRSSRSAMSCYTRVFSFGDSLTDTGNFLEMTAKNPRPFGAPPYGRTYFGRPTGRASDGRLVVDFIAAEFGLSFPTAIQVGRTPGAFKDGANFAVVGATANNNSFFAGRGMRVPPFFLDVQIRWFKLLLQRIAAQQNNSSVLSDALVLLGEIGGNDYNFAFVSGKPREEVRSFVPAVVDKLSGAIEELIGLGATAIVVPGNLPIGCVPLYLRFFKSQDAKDYDARTGCLRWFNDFSQYHNQMLTARLSALRRLHPAVALIYADWYGAMMDIFQSPAQFGFTNPLLACCGNHSVACGNPGCATCDDPSAYGSWDGTHPTEAVYKVIADGVLHGRHAFPTPLAKTCSR